MQCFSQAICIQCVDFKAIPPNSTDSECKCVRFQVHSSLFLRLTGRNISFLDCSVCLLTFCFRHRTSFFGDVRSYRQKKTQKKDSHSRRNWDRFNFLTCQCHSSSRLSRATLSRDFAVTCLILLFETVNSLFEFCTAILVKGFFWRL